MKKNKLLLFITILGFIVVPSHIWANAPTSCGVPSLVTGGGGGIKGVANFIINISTSLPTYAVGTTLGTSNCSGNFSMIEIQENYVKNIHAQLREEASMGSGDHLDSLAMLLGCPQDQHTEIAEVAQKHYVDLFGQLDQSPERVSQFLQQFKEQLREKPALANQCSHLS